MRVQELEKLVEKQAKEIEDLKDFKKKIEIGSYWLRCAFYVTGSIVVFTMAIYEFILKHLEFN